MFIFETIVLLFLNGCPLCSLPGPLAAELESDVVAHVSYTATVTVSGLNSFSCY